MIAGGYCAIQWGVGLGGVCVVGWVGWQWVKGKAEGKIARAELESGGWEDGDSRGGTAN